MATTSKLMKLVYISCKFFLVTFQCISMCNTSYESLCNCLKPKRELFSICTLQCAQMLKISFFLLNACHTGPRSKKEKTALLYSQITHWVKGMPYGITYQVNHLVQSSISLRPRQNGCHFADNIFKCIFWNENVWISFDISLKFVPKVWINNSPALVQIMAWRRSGDKPVSEPMMVTLLTDICITRPQWVNCIPAIEAYASMNQGSFMNAPSQWETTLQCNSVTYWLGAFTTWSLIN